MNDGRGVSTIADGLPAWVLDGRRLADPTPNARDIEEVRRLGGRHSHLRDGEQTAAAIFWSGHPLLPWTRLARILAARQGSQGPNGAEMAAALVSLMTEALAIGERLRSLDHFPRPREWIRGMVEPVNGKRRLDPTWEPLLNSGHGSEYPCDGCIVAGAAVGLLRSCLGTDRLGVALAAPSDDGVTCEFATFSQMLQESEDARVWGGVHFRSTAVASTELGLMFSGHNSPWPQSPPPPPRPTGG